MDVVGLTSSAVHRPGPVPAAHRPTPSGHATTTDTEALEAIAAMLTDTRWDSPADFLEAIAQAIADTGRPHPGEGEPHFHGLAHDPID